jgi:RNA recognition motif-containing protein
MEEESSLVASIFGSEEKNSSLSNIFESSASLPAKPNKQNFTESVSDREKRLREIEKKKKKEESETPESRESKEKNDALLKLEEDRTVFVGNLASGTSRKALASLFKTCGKVKSSRIRSVATAGVKVAPEHAGNQNLVKKISFNKNQLLETSKKTLQGYVVFEEVESVEKALKLNNSSMPNVDGLLLRVDRAKPTIDSARSVFVGNLPYAADETSLRDHFKAGCGFEEDVINNVRIVRDSETMKCKGFGYILLKDKSYIPYALDMHESTYKKRELRVMVAGSKFKSTRNGGKRDKDKKKLDPTKRRLDAKLKKANSISDTILGRTSKNSRAGGKSDAKTPGGAGLSKRAMAKKKTDKRMKQIKKRIEKGMGKGKK